jgi:hypothetical protein
MPVSDERGVDAETGGPKTAKRGAMSPHADATPSSAHLELLGSKYNIAPYWLEEMVLLIDSGATDAEILFDIQHPAGEDGTSLQTIPLTEEQCRGLLADLKALVKQL